MIEVEYNGNNVYKVKKGDKVKEMDFTALQSFYKRNKTKEQFSGIKTTSTGELIGAFDSECFNPEVRHPLFLGSIDDGHRYRVWCYNNKIYYKYPGDCSDYFIEVSSYTSLEDLANNPYRELLPNTFNICGDIEYKGQTLHFFKYLPLRYTRNEKDPTDPNIDCFWVTDGTVMHVALTKSFYLKKFQEWYNTEWQTIKQVCGNDFILNSGNTWIIDEKHIGVSFICAKKTPIQIYEVYTEAEKKQIASLELRGKLLTKQTQQQVEVTTNIDPNGKLLALYIRKRSADETFYIPEGVSSIEKGSVCINLQKDNSKKNYKLQIVLPQTLKTINPRFRKDTNYSNQIQIVIPYKPSPELELQLLAAMDKLYDQTFVCPKSNVISFYSHWVAIRNGYIHFDSSKLVKAAQVTQQYIQTMTSYIQSFTPQDYDVLHKYFCTQYDKTKNIKLAHTFFDTSIASASSRRVLYKHFCDYVQKQSPAFHGKQYTLDYCDVIRYMDQFFAANQDIVKASYTPSNVVDRLESEYLSILLHYYKPKDITVNCFCLNTYLLYANTENIERRYITLADVFKNSKYAQIYANLTKKQTEYVKYLLQEFDPKVTKEVNLFREMFSCYKDLLFTSNRDTTDLTKAEEERLNTIVQALDPYRKETY